MKDPDAIAMQTATARPARPVERRAATGRPWLEIVTKTARAMQGEDCPAGNLSRRIDRELALEDADA